jgi:transmembrane sensor
MTMPIDDRTRPSDELQQQAWVWLRLLNGGDVKPQDADAFKSWLQASDAHKAAFNAARLRWDVLKPVAGELLHADRSAAEVHERTQRRASRPIFGRRAFLGTAVGAAAVAGVAVIYPPARLWPSPNEWGADVRTATGEQRSVRLAERAQVTLNTQTSIRRRMTDKQVTGIDLLAGEAAIDLSAGGIRSFTVMAGAGRSLAKFGHFEVRNLNGKVCVTCIDGELRVEHPAGVRQLVALQQTVYDADSLSDIAGIEAARVSAWRRGELVFEQARLIDVIDEINRYRRGRVLLMNNAVRNKPVSGEFFIATLDQTLSQLQHTFDLNARSLPGGLLLLT